MLTHRITTRCQFQSPPKAAQKKTGDESPGWLLVLYNNRLPMVPTDLKKIDFTLSAITVQASNLLTVRTLT
jgi:hypothetical protein